jgi:hypothetical protein
MIPRRFDHPVAHRTKDHQPGTDTRE